jgi:hypothetical protein
VRVKLATRTPYKTTALPPCFYSLPTTDDDDDDDDESTALILFLSLVVGHLPHHPALST